MAVTSGHGNPKWTREEVVLALDLYFECNGHIPSAADPRVQSLSEVLRAFPHHSLAARKASFRNADGVAFKLQNLRQVATGKGLGNVSETDRKVWGELGSDPAKTKTLAQLIRIGVDVLNEEIEDSGDFVAFQEGRIVTETHLRRERAPKLRTRLIEQRRAQKSLFCDVCECHARPGEPEIVEAIFEAHHIVPLADGVERITKLSDMALLCACCHRLLHRTISVRGTWVSIEEARQTFGSPLDVEFKA